MRGAFFCINVCKLRYGTCFLEPQSPTRGLWLLGGTLWLPRFSTSPRAKFDIYIKTFSAHSYYLISNYSVENICRVYIFFAETALHFQHVQFFIFLFLYPHTNNFSWCSGFVYLRWDCSDHRLKSSKVGL